MRQISRFCAGVVLALTFALPTLAGHIPCGVTDDPPPTMTATTDETGDGVLQVFGALLEGVLSVL